MCSSDLEIPGLELRQVPALTTGGNEHAGLSELIWTSPERLATLRNSASAASSSANAGPSFGATMIVNSPVAGPRTEPRTAGQPVGVPSGSDSAKKPDESARTPLKMEEAGFDQDLANLEEPRSSFSTSALVVGAIVVVVVGLAVAWFHPWSSPKARPVPAVISTPTPEPTGNSTPTATPTSDTPTVTQPSITEAPEPAKAAKKPEKSKAKEAKKPEDTPIKNFEGTSAYDGMTQKDIPRLLQWARSEQGNGNYASAAQKYRVILQMQPNHPDAKEGLRKIQVAQGSSQ